MSRRLLGLVLMLPVVLTSTCAYCATWPVGVGESVYATGLTRPVQMAFAPDGRLFVAEQDGNLRVIDTEGNLLPAPFLSLVGQVRTEWERGLISVAFDPEFAANNYIYVFYTANTTPIKNRVSRFTANGNVVVPGSEFIILEETVIPDRYWHNGGALHFGPNGLLYIAFGENHQPGQAQNLGTLHGKILRIFKNGDVPTNNPLYGRPGVNPRIWAYGLRNPFTFDISFATGRIYINDVGDSDVLPNIAYEELNRGRPGANYGWGDTRHDGPYIPPDPRYDNPVYSYVHVSGGECAITGAAFYEPKVAPKLPASYVGKYFFADNCANWIRVLDPDNEANVQDFGTAISGDPTDIDVGPDGALYYVGRFGGLAGTGRVVRIAEIGEAPAISVQPENERVAPGKSVTFSVTATGATPLRYQWRKNGVDIPGATSASYVIPSAALSDNDAKFRVVVRNAAGSVTSREVTLTVSTNQPPVATILTPATTFLYSANAPIAFSGSATDAEDGQLPASAFTWTVVFHHADHVHPAMPETTGSKTGSYLVPANDHVATNVWYRIHLTVKDSDGLTHSIFRDVFPRLVNLTLQTSPPGLTVAIEGTEAAAPFVPQSVAGVTRTLRALTPQTKSGVRYEFASWSDGGAAMHDISTPSTNRTYTATFRQTCGANAIGSINVIRSGVRYDPVTRRQTHTLSLTNVSASPITGPVTLALDNLGSNATLYNLQGATACALPAGSPFVHVNIGTDNVLSPGESVPVLLEFVNSIPDLGIAYTPRVLTGSGGR